MESSSPAPHSPQPVPDWLRELGWAEVYEVRRLIGRGGMGRVYEGWHLTLGIPVALKIIDPHLAGEDHVRARFEKEAMTLARLQEPVPHPNIVRVIDFKLLESVGCIVMAYVKGMDVRAWCVDRELDQRARVSLISQVARAAGYFHSFGLVHRDLKPANVLVREGSGDPVIVDFGIVRGREDVTLTRTQQALGTAAYMAPELLRVPGIENTTKSTTDATVDATAPGEITPAADVYALGVLLYELLCGEVPYGTTLAEVLPCHQRESPPRIITSELQRIPRDLERVCLKAIAHRPSERYANGTGLAEDLERFLRDEPVLARPVSRARHMVRRARRRPYLLIAAAAGLLLAGLAVFRLAWDAKQVHLAQLREAIGLNMPSTSWSTDQMLKTDRLIDEFEEHDPEQAALFHRSLVQGAGREIVSLLKHPRISESERTEIQQTLDWIHRHDPAEAAKLRLLVEERHSRWDSLLEIRPPFENLAKSLSAEHSHVEGDHLILDGASTKDRLIHFSRAAPLDITATLAIPERGIQVLGFKVLLFDDWHSFQLHQPPTNSTLDHLNRLQSSPAAPPATLTIARKDRILAVTPLPSTIPPGKALRMRLHIESRKLSLELSDGSRVEYLLRYQPVHPVSVALIGVPELRLHDLRWSGPTDLPKNSLLEKGDHYAGSERWWPAETYFLQMAGDPECGLEALFKAGDCQLQQGRHAAAQATWEKLMRGPPSPWRTEACLQLWYLHANAGRLINARVYLDQLPGPEDLPEDYYTQISQPRRTLDDYYRSVGRGLHLLRPVPAVEDAVRVHRMLRYPSMEIAARFALSRHFNGTDEAARDLLFKGLNLKSVSKITPEEERTFNTNFELWSLITRSESDPALATYQTDWLKRLPPEHSLTQTIRLDQARQFARAGQKEAAIAIAQDVLKSEQSTIMAFTGAALILTALDADPSHTAVHHAIARVTQSKRQVHELTLIHRLLLHSIVQNWTRQSTVDILSQLLSLGEAGENRETLRGRISRFLLDDQGMTFSLNQLLTSENGKALLTTFALRTQPIRQTTRNLFYAILRRHVIYSAYGPKANPAQMTHAASVAQFWLKYYAERQISDDDFFILMEHLKGAEMSPALKSAIVRWPPPLRTAVQACFQNRRSPLPLSSKS